MQRTNIKQSVITLKYALNSLYYNFCFRLNKIRENDCQMFEMLSSTYVLSLCTEVHE